MFRAVYIIQPAVHIDPFPDVVVQLTAICWSYQIISCNIATEKFSEDVNGKRSIFKYLYYHVLVGPPTCSLGLCAVPTPNPPFRMVSMTLTILPYRTFNLCGTILIKRESGERKKLGLMQDTASTREPMH